nr:hypothetical protein [Tanacetum cinerariifolium]
MPLLAHMLNQGEPAFIQAQQQEVYPPLPSPVVAPHPSPDPMPSPLRQSSPPPVPFGLTPSSGIASTEPIPDIPSSSRPSEPVLETITSPIRDDDTGGGSFYESPPSHPLATLTHSPTVGVAEEPLTLTSLLALFPTFLQRIATLEAKLKATKILHRDTVVLFAKRIKKLESTLKTKRGNCDTTTPSKPANQEQSSEQEISPTTLDAVLTPSQSKAKARAATIIYKCIKKQHGADSASGLTSTGISVAAGPTVSAKPSSHIRYPAKGKAVVTPSSPVTAPTDKELAYQQAVILEAERQELLEEELKQSLDAEQVYLDSLLAQRVAEEQERESRASAAQSLVVIIYLKGVSFEHLASLLREHHWKGSYAGRPCLLDGHPCLSDGRLCPDGRLDQPDGHLCPDG